MNLQELISKGESDTLEFKESFGKEVTITAGAFANSRGGFILIGISDDGKIIGTRVGKETPRRWANDISQATEPQVIPEIEVRRIGRLLFRDLSHSLLKSLTRPCIEIYEI